MHPCDPWVCKRCRRGSVSAGPGAGLLLLRLRAGPLGPGATRRCPGSRVRVPGLPSLQSGLGIEQAVSMRAFPFLLWGLVGEAALLPALGSWKADLA